MGMQPAIRASLSAGDPSLAPRITRQNVASCKRSVQLYYHTGHSNQLQRNPHPSTSWDWGVEKEKQEKPRDVIPDPPAKSLDICTLCSHNNGVCSSKVSVHLDRCPAARTGKDFAAADLSGWTCTPDGDPAGRTQSATDDLPWGHTSTMEVIKLRTHHGSYQTEDTPVPWKLSNWEQTSTMEITKLRTHQYQESYQTEDTPGKLWNWGHASTMEVINWEHTSTMEVIKLRTHQGSYQIEDMPVPWKLSNWEHTSTMEVIKLTHQGSYQTEDMLVPWMLSNWGHTCTNPWMLSEDTPAPWKLSKTETERKREREIIIR